MINKHSPETEAHMPNENALADYKEAQNEKRLQSLEEAVKQLTQERNNALKWGIMTLGTAVLGMGAWIFNFVVGHLK